jgi:transposase
MESSLLYQGFSLRKQECLCTEYKDNSIYLNVQTKSQYLRCPECGGIHYVRNGVVVRDIRTVPIGRRRTVLRTHIQKMICHDCSYIGQEHLAFVTGKRTYTNQFARFVVELSRIGTIKDVAAFLHLSWDTVKDIQKRYLKVHFGSPSFSGVENIGIDEFAVRKGHVYKTIVVDLDTGRIIYAGQGKGADALNFFWKKAKRNKVNIKAVATDLSPAFIASVMEHAPETVHVFDHFHVVKLMNDKLDDIRRKTYAAETDVNRRKVLKGSRWLLLCNGKDVMDGMYKNRLENALDMNKDLMKAYYLKEDLIQIWLQTDKQQAWKALDNWCRQARDSKVKGLIQMANTLLAYRTGILAWYDIRISTAKVEGINHKVKNMMRQAYGYRDDDFFKLKLYSLHDKISSFVG